MLRTRKRPKQRVIKLYLDGTFEEKKIPFSRNFLEDGPDLVEWEPICVFTERRSLKKVHKSGRKFIFYVDGALKALRFKATDDKMNPFWTIREAKDFVFKVLAQALQKFKPMTWAQFVILLVPMLIMLVVMFKVAIQIGAF